MIIDWTSATIGSERKSAALGTFQCEAEQQPPRAEQPKYEREY
jgi:hypothetical protein